MIKDFGDMNNVTVGIVLFNSRLDRVILIKRERTSVFQQKYSAPSGRVKLVWGIKRSVYLIVDENSNKVVDIMKVICSNNINGEKNEAYKKFT